MRCSRSPSRFHGSAYCRSRQAGPPRPGRAREQQPPLARGSDRNLTVPQRDVTAGQLGRQPQHVRRRADGREVRRGPAPRLMTARFSRLAHPAQCPQGTPCSQETPAFRKHRALRKHRGVGERVRGGSRSHSSRSPDSGNGLPALAEQLRRSSASDPPGAASSPGPTAPGSLVSRRASHRTCLVTPYPAGQRLSAETPSGPRMPSTVTCPASACGGSRRSAGRPELQRVGQLAESMNTCCA